MVLVLGVVVVVGRGPLVGTVGTSCVVLGGRGVVGGRGLSGLKPGGRRAEMSSRMTGTAGETRKPSIRSPGGGRVVTSSSGRLAAWWRRMFVMTDCFKIYRYSGNIYV